MGKGKRQAFCGLGEKTEKQERRVIMAEQTIDKVQIEVKASAKGVSVCVR